MEHQNAEAVRTKAVAKEIGETLGHLARTAGALTHIELLAQSRQLTAVADYAVIGQSLIRQAFARARSGAEFEDMVDLADMLGLIRNDVLEQSIGPVVAFAEESVLSILAEHAVVSDAEALATV